MDFIVSNFGKGVARDIVIGIQEIGQKAFYWCGFPENSISIPEGANFGFLSFNDEAIDKTSLSTYTVTYDLDGGALASDNTNPVSFTVLDSFVLNNPKKEHYEFVGWTCSGGLTFTEPKQSFNVPYKTKGDLAFKANWTPVTHRVHYELNGGTNHPSNPEVYPETAAIGSIPINMPYREGYLFTGWSEYADAEGNPPVRSPSIPQNVTEGAMVGKGNECPYYFTAHWTPLRTDTPDQEYNGQPYSVLDGNAAGTTTYHYVGAAEGSYIYTAPTVPGDYVAKIDYMDGVHVVESPFTIKPKLITVTGLKAKATGYELGSDIVELDISDATLSGVVNAGDITVKSARGKIRNLGVGNAKQIDIVSITFGGTHPEYYRILDKIEKIDEPTRGGDATPALLHTEGDETALVPLQDDGVVLPQTSLVGNVVWVESWSSFQSALDTCPNGSTLKLSGDLVAASGDASLTVPAGRTVTIDLMGYTLNASELGDCALLVKGVLTLQDSVGSGKITGGTKSGVRVEAGSETIEGASVAYKGSLLIYGGNISGNSSTSTGGGVSLSPGSKFAMLGGCISGNTAGTTGGGVYVPSGASCYLENGRVLGNTANEVENNIYLAKDSLIRIAFKLDEDAAFGVTTEDTPTEGKPITITKGLVLAGTDGISHFSSDNDIWQIAVNSSEAVLAAEESSSDKVLQTAALVLHNDISVRFYAKPPAGATDVSMVFSMNGKSTTVSGKDIGNGRLQFTYDGVRPQYMGDEIAATIFYTVDGVAQTESMTYSIRQYCEKLLSYTDDQLRPLVSANGTVPEIKKLIVDVLYYGAEAQRYMNHNTENLCTSGLTEAQKENASTYARPTETQGVLTTRRSGEDDVSYQWISASVSLTNAAAIRFYFSAANVENLVIEMKRGELDSRTFDKSQFHPDGNRYYVEIPQISAADFRKEIIANFKVNNSIVGQTLHYSMNTYISQADTDANAGDLVKALYNYGESAYAYANAN